MNLNYSDAYDARGLPAKWLRRLRKRSGVYVIRKKTLIFETVLYVGESHSDTLRKTILRHFQKWKGETSGNTYKRDAVEVAVIPCPAADAVELQNKLIRELLPEDNIYGKGGDEAEAGKTPF